MNKLNEALDRGIEAVDKSLAMGSLAGVSDDHVIASMHRFLKLIFVEMKEPESSEEHKLKVVAHELNQPVMVPNENLYTQKDIEEKLKPLAEMPTSMYSSVKHAEAILKKVKSQVLFNFGVSYDKEH